MFLMFVHEFLVKLDSQWQFWNLLVMRIPKQKFWQSYLSLKTIDSISKINCSSITFCLEIEPCLLPGISQPKLHQIKHVGGVLQFPWWAESKTVIGWPSWHSFQGKTRETSCWEIREITAIIMPSWDTIEESWLWALCILICFSQYCYCGNAPGKKVDDSFCNKPCSGDSSKICGGSTSCSYCSNGYESVYGTGRWGSNTSLIRNQNDTVY